MATATKAPKAALKKLAPAAKKAKAVNPILEAFPTAKQVKVKGVEDPYFQIPASEIEDYLVKQQLRISVHDRRDGPFIPWEEVKKDLNL